MSIFVSANTQPMSNIQNQMQINQPKRPEPLKDEILQLSKESQDKFKNMVDSLSHEQRKELGGMMMQSKKELSSLSEDEFENELFAMVDSLSSSEPMTNTEMSQQATQSGMMPPPPPPPMLSKETTESLNSAVGSMDKDEKKKFDEQMKSLDGNNRMQFGAILKQKEQEISGMSPEELKESIFNMIEESKMSSQQNTSARPYFLSTYA
jgi:hypothetical protein